MLVLLRRLDEPEVTTKLVPEVDFPSFLSLGVPEVKPAKLIRDTLGEDDFRRILVPEASVPFPFPFGGANRVVDDPVKGTLSTTVGSGVIAGKTPPIAAGCGAAAAIIAMIPMAGLGSSMVGGWKPLGFKPLIVMPIPTGKWKFELKFGLKGVAHGHGNTFTPKIFF